MKSASIIVLCCASFSFAFESASPKFKNLRYSAAQDAAARPVKPAAGPRRFSTTLVARPIADTPPPAPKARRSARPIRRASATRTPHQGSFSPPARVSPWTPIVGMLAAAALAAALAALFLRKRRRRDSERLSLVAHELKSPLSAIESALSLMLHEGSGAQSQEVRLWLDDARRLKSTASHLQRTISDLLEMTQLDSGKLVLSRRSVALDGLAAEAGRLYSSIASERGITLSVAESGRVPEAWADEGKIRQVLNNLLSNALKFTPAGGAVTIEIDEEQGAARCTIRDTGTGIAAADLDRLFGRFVRLAPAAHGSEGTGLGLFISKVIIEAHGGRIWAESRLEQGSAFRFILPARPSQTPGQTAA